MSKRHRSESLFQTSTLAVLYDGDSDDIAPYTRIDRENVKCGAQEDSDERRARWINPMPAESEHEDGSPLHFVPENQHASRAYEPEACGCDRDAGIVCTDCFVYTVLTHK